MNKIDYKKLKNKLLNRETILYTIFGILTFFVGIIVYQVFLYFGVDYKISNLFSLILGKLFAYVMNKFFVFRCRQDNFNAFLKEFMSFVFARGLTALVDYFGVIVMVEIFGMDKLLSKYLFQIIVIFMNYFFGKQMVFKKRS
ncbi:MAG: GtrA family protein [Clostridia bacterium]|jgi:putative flippase GtrA|nr:GtrA family protein [Clostridia bacterium]